MTRKEMEVFLDNAYLTGFNNGQYAATLENGSEEQYAEMEYDSYDEKWLAAEAEEATRFVFSEDNDIYLTNALCEAI